MGRKTKAEGTPERYQRPMRLTDDEFGAIVHHIASKAKDYRSAGIRPQFGPVALAYLRHGVDGKVMPKELKGYGGTADVIGTLGRRRD